jgi:hypothetical protein
MERLDRWAVDHVMAHVKTPQFRDAVKAARARKEQAAARERLLQQGLRADEQALQRLSDAYDDGGISGAEYRRRRDRMLERTRENNRILRQAAQAAALATVPALPRLRCILADPDTPVADKRALILPVVDRIVVSRLPAGMAPAVTRRKGEAAEELERRRDRHAAAVMASRVEILWSVEVHCA